MKRARLCLGSWELNVECSPHKYLMNTGSPIIEIQNLSRRYGELDAVNGPPPAVRAGKCYGYFGRDGAGKPALRVQHVLTPFLRPIHPPRH